MNRMWRYVAIVSVLIMVLLTACSQASAPAASGSQKPAEKAVETPAQKAAEKPAEKAAEKPASKNLPSTIAMGTSPSGSAYNSTATGVAKVISQFSPIRVLVKPMSGPNAWLPMADTGEIETGISAGLDAAWAYNGDPMYGGKPHKNVRVVLMGNDIVIPGLIVRNDSDIKSVKDLKGKRVGSEYGGNKIMHIHAQAFLESVGLTWNDVTPVPVTDIASGLKALREGRADAVFGGSPLTAATLEVDAAIGVRALNFGDLTYEQGANPPKQLVDNLRKLLPGEQVVQVKKHGYMKSDATLYKHSIYLVASDKLSADAVYEITKAIYNNDKELQPLYDWLKDWKQDTMFNPDPPTPYHEGAIRFWKEKGLWNAQAEANQKKLLGQ